ncbi:MAG: rod shape-determining protein RodA [Verrucomicrobia bacterium]|nr:rod shape-determining protein RodA [Verrucomicrobiota bacterium]
MFETHLNERGKQVDIPLVLAILALMCIGVTFIFSAAYANESARNLPLFHQLYFRQVLWYTIGVGAALFLCFVDYRSWARWSFVGYWLIIIVLLLVLIPGIGVTRFGARRWIDLGFFQFQPSEFAKIAIIFAQANFLSRPAEELRQLRVFLKSLGMTAIPFVFILLEPDLGSALVLFPITFVMMFVAGVPKSFLVKLIGGTSIVIALLLVDILFAPPQWQIKLEEYQRHRLLTYFGISFAPKDATPEQKKKADALQRAKSYNVEQALISVGSGGLTGKGWRQGTQYSLGFLPRAVAHNDFIFSVIAEEKGFVGSAFVIVLYTVILFSGIKIAGQARDRLGKLLAAGVIAMLFSHVFINIGMNIRLMPVTGIPLPLLSYGGSSVLCSLIAIGILQNVYMYRRSY